MNITVRKLELENFKCFQHKTVDFSSDVTVIRGRNGSGKTTIADAILWCLFGKNSQGQSDFDLKTHDSSGRPIPNLDHSVEMELCVRNLVNDGKDEKAYSVKTITLKRTLKETWVKKRGSDEQVFKNNTTEYLVNGELTTAADYKKYISSLISEETFRAITSPTYFPSLKWQQQRDFLTKMAGDITAPDDAKFAALTKQLYDSGEDITARLKHIGYQLKQVKDKLEKIPVRLEEQNKALPPLLDWQSLSVQSVATESQLKELDSKILAIRSGNGNDVRKDQLRKELDEVTTQLYDIKSSHLARLQTLRIERDGKLAEYTRQFSSLLHDQRDIENSLPSFDRLIERCRETLAECEKDAQYIREAWANNLERHVEWDDSQNYCPVCGQYLPEDKLQQHRAEAEQAMNETKARTKKQLIEHAERVKADRAEAEKSIKDYEQQKADAERKLTETKQAVTHVFSEKAQIEKTPVPSIDEALTADDSYQQLLARSESIRNEMESSSVTSDEQAKALADLETRRSECAALLAQLQQQLSTKSQYDRIQSLIEGIHKEQRDLVAQQSELERSEDIARQYQDSQNQILESRINEHFEFVQWRMFRIVNNGGDPFPEPYCECYVNGVAYHDGLNQAARLNAGLDIINALCRHYSVSAPIVIDNSESTLDILPTASQQIRLEVAVSDLQIN